MLICNIFSINITKRCIFQNIKNSASNQQQSPPEQSQDGSVPVSIPLIIAAAQPTPACTVMACWLQFFAQAPHSIQLFLSIITDFLSFISKTLWGQTVKHFWQPLHFRVSSSSVTTFFRY